jgi:heat shock protein HslJ
VIRRLHYLSTIAMIVTACATAARQPTTPPTDVQWRLVELVGVRVIASPGGREAGLLFAGEGSRVTGFTTCNNLFGSYEAPGAGRLRFRQLGSTKMACIEADRARQEQQFMAALQRVDGFTVAGDTLTLLEGNQPLARLAAGQSR